MTWDILSGIEKKTTSLKLTHKIVFYEGIGHLLAFIEDEQVLSHCLTTTLQPLMESWKGLLASGGSNSEFLKNYKNYKKTT